jgi:hypothetical protein
MFLRFWLRLLIKCWKCVERQHSDSSYNRKIYSWWIFDAYRNPIRSHNKVNKMIWSRHQQAKVLNIHCTHMIWPKWPNSTNRASQNWANNNKLTSQPNGSRLHQYQVIWTLKSNVDGQIRFLFHETNKKLCSLKK